MTDSDPSSPDEKPQAPQPYPAYSQMPGYGEPPAEGPPPFPPSTVNLAAKLLYVIAGIGVLATLLVFAVRDDLEEEVRKDDPSRSAEDVDAVVNGLIALSVAVGLLFAGLYVLLGRKITQGRGWARIVATVLLGLAVLNGLTSGPQSLPDASVVLSVISAIVAAVALVLLWMRPTGEFISETARRRSR